MRGQNDGFDASVRLPAFFCAVVRVGRKKADPVRGQAARTNLIVCDQMLANRFGPSAGYGDIHIQRTGVIRVPDQGNGDVRVGFQQFGKLLQRRKWTCAQSLRASLEIQTFKDMSFGRQLRLR